MSGAHLFVELRGLGEAGGAAKVVRPEHPGPALRLARNDLG